MKEKITFLRLPIVLILIFFFGRLVMGAAGASYDAGNRVFSMVILETHLALIWGAVGRRYGGYRLAGAVQLGILIGVVTQILILGATLVSDLGGIDTYFNNPIAVTGSSEAISFGEAMVVRIVGFVANAALAAVLAVLGWTLGSLLPEPARVG